MVLYVVKEKNVLVTAKELWEESYWNKCRPLTLPNFVTLRQEMCRISTEKSCAPRKVDQSWPKSLRSCAPMPLIMPNFIALCQTMYKKSVTKHVLHPSVFCHPRGTLAQSWPWHTASPSLSICQISSCSDSPSTRYLLPNFVNFGDGVTDKKATQKTINDVSA